MCASTLTNINTSVSPSKFETYSHYISSHTSPRLNIHSTCQLAFSGEFIDMTATPSLTSVLTYFPAVKEENTKKIRKTRILHSDFIPIHDKFCLAFTKNCSLKFQQNSKCISADVKKKKRYIHCWQIKSAQCTEKKCKQSALDFW